MLKQTNVQQLISTLICLIAFAQFGWTQTISFGKRDAVFSSILNESRPFSVYLPPSYTGTVNQNYPVLYILDGDYNFQYVAGLLELQGGISELIPELILVALSGKGTPTYRKNCKPKIDGVKDSGNAEEVALFIKNELIPYVDSNYKTASYKMLAGHSVGGLFVINTALNHPNLFNQYLAISPALWWADNAVNQLAKDKLTDNDQFKTSVYVSLANEKGMGIDAFFKVIPKPIRKASFKYQHFPEENHNSVGLPTYVWALKDIFKIWSGSQDYFTSAKAMETHFEKVRTEYGDLFNAPLGVLAYTGFKLRKNESEYTLFLNRLKVLHPNAYVAFINYKASQLISEKKLVDASTILENIKPVNPNSINMYHNLAKIALEASNFTKALDLINKAIALSVEQETRQWQVNELLDTRLRIEQHLK